MEAMVFRVVLVAQRSGVNELVNTVGADFRDRQVRYSTTHVLLGMLAVLVLFVVMVLGARGLEAVRRHLRGSRRWLFWRLCRAHRLGFGDGHLLWRLARLRRLDEPARVFVEPEQFDPATLPSAIQGRVGRLMELQNHLFAASEERQRPSALTADGPTKESLCPPQKAADAPASPALVFDSATWQGMLPVGEDLRL